jgi:hypothetical protein
MHKNGAERRAVYTSTARVVGFHSRVRRLTRSPTPALPPSSSACPERARQDKPRSHPIRHNRLMIRHILRAAVDLQKLEIALQKLEDGIWKCADALQKLDDALQK